MHPILFSFDTPSFLQGIFPDTITIYSYGFLIALGAALAFTYTAWQAKKHFNLPVHKSSDLALLLLLSAFVGGKLFFYLEDPGHYFEDPSRMLNKMGKGFVFYGSLLFCIPAMLIYFRKNKLPVWPMLDIMAITTCIVHMFGRMGCFMAGCCYGLPWEDGVCAVTFIDPQSMARPLETPLHPTQLYSSSLIFTILLFLLFIRSRKSFDGQVFLMYLVLYSVGRSIIEIFRGDYQRGYIIEDLLSHSQLIALCVLAGVGYVYLRFFKKRKAKS